MKQKRQFLKKNRFQNFDITDLDELKKSNDEKKENEDENVKKIWFELKTSKREP